MDIPSDYHKQAEWVKRRKIFPFWRKIAKEVPPDLIRILFSELGEDNKPAKEGYYPSVRYDICGFKHIMDRVMSYNPKSFLDVGSSNGQMLFVAKEIYDIPRVAGIEISEKSHKIARKFLPKEYELYNQDAFDSADIINQFDLVYMWRPIMNFELLGKLTRHVLANMKVGSIFADLYSHDKRESMFERNAPTGYYIYPSEKEVRIDGCDLIISKKIGSNRFQLLNGNNYEFEVKEVA